MRTTYTYICSKGHLVKAENSQIRIDSLCGRCKRQTARAYRKFDRAIDARPADRRQLQKPGAKA